MSDNVVPIKPPQSGNGAREALIKVLGPLWAEGFKVVPIDDE